MKDEKTCNKKWKAKLIFRGARNSLMAWPDWPRPPYLTTDLHHWAGWHPSWTSITVSVPSCRLCDISTDVWERRVVSVLTCIWRESTLQFHAAAWYMSPTIWTNSHPLLNLFYSFQPVTHIQPLSLLYGGGDDDNNMKNLGVPSASARQLLSDLGRRLTDISGESCETSYPFQRFSVLVQRFNAVLLHDSLPDRDCTDY